MNDDAIWKELTDISKLSEQDQKEILEETKRLFEAIPKAVDFMIKHSKKERWEIVLRAMEVLESGFRSKMN